MTVPTNVTKETWAKGLGLLAGILLAGALLLGGRIPAGDGRASADVLFTAGPTGELAVAPTGPVLAATGLIPGTSARGTLAVTNQTGKRLRITLRALPESRDLDRILRVQLRLGPATLFSGALGDLRTPRTSFLLASGRTGRLQLRAWLPRTVELGNAGRVVAVPLELSSQVAA